MSSEPDQELDNFTEEVHRDLNFRVFRGSRNYVKFFNNQLRDIVEPEDASSVPYHHNDRTVGTPWTGAQKDHFFKLLARYSVHNLDLIALHLNKSEIDVLNYYKRLKRQLRKMKASKKHFHKLVRMDEMPAAFEMSNSFVRFEEYQLEAMSFLERIRLNDKNRLYLFKNHEEGLINNEMLYELAKYYLQTSFQSRKSSRPMKLVPESYSYLERIARLVTRKLLLDIVSCKTVVPTMVHSKGLYDEYLESLHRVVVGPTSVLLSYKRLFPRYPANLKNYWVDSVYKLDVEVLNIDGRRINFSQRRRGILNKEIEEYIFGPKKSKYQLADVEDDDSGVIQESQSSEEDEETDKMLEVHKIEEIKGSDEEEGVEEFDPDTDPSVSVENSTAFKVFAQESKYLNDKDLEKSRYHEHIILTYLSTYENPKLIDDDEEMLKYFEKEKEEDEDLLEDMERDFYESSADETEPEESESSLGDNDVDPEMVIMQLYDYAAY